VGSLGKKNPTKYNHPIKNHDEAKNTNLTRATGTPNLCAKPPHNPNKYLSSELQ
jgi:hypothetical protein